MAETSFMEGIDLKTLRNSIKIAHAKDEMRNQFSNMKESGIQFSFNENERVVMEKRVGQREEPVRIFKRKGTGLPASFIKRFQLILGSKRVVLITQKDKEIEELQRSTQEDERTVYGESQEKQQ